MQVAVANAPELRSDGIRLLLVTVLGTAILFGVLRRKLVGSAALGFVLFFILADAWIVGRRFFEFSPGASVTYGDDPVTTRIRQTPIPYRVWAPAGATFGQLGPYPRSWLMAREIPQLFGYHGNEIRYFDELLGGKENWEHQVSPNILDLYAIRFAVVADSVDIPGFHRVLGPVTTTPGSPAYLYEANTVPPYVRVMSSAAKAPEEQIRGALVDTRFPLSRVVLYADTASVAPAPLDSVPPASGVAAKVSSWEPGRIRIALTGNATTPQYLVVSENWYKDWHASIDGREAPLLRGQYALLSVAIPPGSKEVAFEFRSAAYRKGRLISLVALLGVLGLYAVPMIRRRTASAKA
jgi:hypothetical protein